MKINYSFLLLISLSILLDNLMIVLIMILSLLLHEFGHLIIIFIKKIKILRFELTFLGGKIIIDEKSLLYQKNFDKSLLYISGVFTNLIVFLSLTIIKTESLFINYFKICNLILLIINIIPIYPTDGYNILAIFLPRRSLYNISICFMVLFLLYSIYYGILSLILLFIYCLVLNINKIKKNDYGYLHQMIKSMV